MRIILIRVLWFMAPLAVMSLPISVSAASTEPLRFVTMDLAPYGFADGERSRPGIFRKINAAIATRAGIEFTDEVVPLKRMVKQIQRGQSDCGTLIRTLWNKDNLEAVAEIQVRFNSIVVTRVGLPVTGLADIHGRLLALPRGAYVGTAVAEDPKIRRYQTNGYGQSARLLKAGRVDAIAGSALSILYNLGRVRMRRKDFGGVFVFDSKPLWLQCTKGKLPRQIVERLRKAADSLRDEGVFDRIIQSYR